MQDRFSLPCLSLTKRKGERIGQSVPGGCEPELREIWTRREVVGMTWGTRELRVLARIWLSTVPWRPHQQRKVVKMRAESMEGRERGGLSEVHL